MSPHWTSGALLVGALSLLLALASSRRAIVPWLVSSLLASAALAGAALSVLLTATTWRGVIPWEFGGEPVMLLLDGISALFLLLLAVITGAGALYSTEYWADAAHPRSGPTARMWWTVVTGSIACVLLSAHGLGFLAAWELFAVANYFLVTIERRKASARAAGWLYLGASHTATLALFAFFGAMAAHLGTWQLGPRSDDPALAPLFWLALFGFGLKAGMFPLHVWLPSAHANAPSHVSALMSGMALKVGIYGLVRAAGWVAMPEGASWVVLALGVASSVLGVAFALGQHDLKRLLAYHSVENIGIILMGLGLAMVAADADDAASGRLALTGALLHVWNHGLFKALLFLGAGSVVHATGTRTMSALGGLWRAMPWTTALFALGAAAIAGLPPLNGFVSEWLIYLSLTDLVNDHGSTAIVAVLVIVALAVTGALALACFAKVCGVVFLGAARSADAERAHECGWRMRAPMLLLATGCVAIGVAPPVVWGLLAPAVAIWNPAWSGVAAPSSLFWLAGWHAGIVVVVVGGSVLALRHVWSRGLRRALTWDCGYAAPTARMQYTAGSFASIITEWFAGVLRPERHVDPVVALFPARSSYHEHTPETVLERVVEPIAGYVLGLSTWVRRFQHGRVHAYLVYVLLALVTLGAVVGFEARRP